MKKYVICKVCGFIMEEKDLKDVCPACGVPKTAFVEYKSKVSEKRENFLNLHLHPITVHFPEAIAVFSTGFLMLSFILSGSFSENLLTTVKILSIFFPITVLIAVISGIYDGKVRFKKLSPPYLKIKIYLGVILFVSSILTIVLIETSFRTVSEKAIVFVLSLVNLATCTALGKIGGRLTDSKMPG